MDPDHDLLADLLRADAARVKAPAPAGLADRARARVAAERARPPRRAARVWWAAAAAALVVGAASFLVPGPRAIVAPRAEPPPTQVARSTPPTLSPLSQLGRFDLARLPAVADAPFEDELARMRGDAGATMSFLIAALPEQERR
jgi:hypothetical protein